MAPYALLVPISGLWTDGVRLTWGTSEPTRFVLSGVLAATGALWLLGVVLPPRFRGALLLGGVLLAPCWAGVGGWILADLVRFQLMLTGGQGDPMHLVFLALVGRTIGHAVGALVPAAAAGRLPSVVVVLGASMTLAGALQVWCVSTFLQERWGTLWSDDPVTLAVTVTVALQALAVAGALVVATGPAVSPGGTDAPLDPPRTA